MLLAAAPGLRRFVEAAHVENSHTPRTSRDEQHVAQKGDVGPLRRIYNWLFSVAENPVRQDHLNSAVFLQRGRIEESDLSPLASKTVLEHTIREPGLAQDDAREGLGVPVPQEGSAFPRCGMEWVS